MLLHMVTLLCCQDELSQLRFQLKEMELNVKKHHLQHEKLEQEKERLEKENQALKQQLDKRLDTVRCNFPLLSSLLNPITLSTNVCAAVLISGECDVKVLETQMI